MRAGELHLRVCYTPVPQHIVNNDDAPRTNQAQELVEVSLIGPLVRICHI